MTEHADLLCDKHGITGHYKSSKYNFKCKKCNVEAVTRRRRKAIKLVKEEYGGCCTLCGYDRCIRSLVFHHINPNEKELKLGSGNTGSIKRLREEAAKCVLVCSNCHGEIHEGMHPEYLKED